jgi:hypothetical protein
MGFRHEPRDIVARSLHIRADSANSDAGTVEATVATEKPATVFDFESFRIIDEVLIAEGGEFPQRVPLLDSHDRSRAKDVLGSATGFTRNGSEWVGRAEFDTDDQDAVRVFNKVKARHITDVSIGYRVLDFVDIPPKKSQTINGRKYTAGERVLRVSNRWQVRELSVTPIGADSNAKFRDSADDFKEFDAMNPRLLEYLRRLGLSRDATDEQAREFARGLRGSQRSLSSLLDYDEADAAAATTADLAIRSLGFNPSEPWNVLESQRSEEDTDETDDSTDDSQDNSANSFSAGQRAERDRQNAIREIGRTIVPSDMIERAITEGMTVDDASFQFLAYLRGQRSDGQGTDRPDEGSSPVGELMVRSMHVIGAAPSAQATSREAQRNSVSMAMALMQREAITSDVVSSYVAVDGQNIRRFSDSHRDELERAAEHSHQMRDMSLVDIAQECLRMNGVTMSRYSASGVISELQRSGVSTATFTGIITTNFSAQLLAGYDTATDTTEPWTSSGDLPDFRTADRPRVLQGDPLTKHARAGTAEHVTFSDKSESYKAARYSGQFVVDEMDMIDDRLGALDQLAPMDMGVAARHIRPDLVYSILLANDNMSDGVALFHTATHGNLQATAALAEATIKSSITLFNTQTENGRLLDKNGPIVFIVPEALSFTAEQLLNSNEISNDSGKGNMNTLRSRATSIVSDGRLDNGVTDPASGTVHAGSATTWFAARSSGRHTIEVGYVRGSGRAPTVRSFILTQGQWGIGWDVKLDIGAKALDWLGLQKSTA